jgi:hypothetical protein
VTLQSLRRRVRQLKIELIARAVAVLTAVWALD